jgi:hypothetical protein
MDGCYDDIVIRIKPVVDELLARPGILPIEKLMLESIRDHEEK